jgi:hypothetical protein
MGFFQRLKEAFNPPSPEPEKPFREAAGITIDEDEDQWRPLTGDSRRDLSPLTQTRMQELAIYLWRGNPLANRLIELPMAFLLANGVEVTVADEEAQKWLKLFWKDPINRMELKLPKKVRELAIFGEQCWPTFVNEVNGHVRLGYLDPGRIATVVTDPDNIEQPIGVVTKADNKGNKRRYRVIVNGPEEMFTLRTQEIRKTFTDGDCFYFTVNDLSSSNRGHSDLLPQMDWLDAYDKALFGEIDRWDMLRSFLWDVTLNGATKEQVEERAKEIAPPAPGSVRVHNDSETWKTESPDLNSTDTTSLARLFRTHIMGGGTLPEHWYGMGGDVNRATAQAMDDPTFKIFKMRQGIWVAILEEVASYVIHQRLLAIYGARPSDEEMADYTPTATFPEMITKDTTTYAAAFQQVVVGCSSAMDRGLLSEETAVLIITQVASNLGVMIDAKDELEKARSDADKRKQEDSFSDFGALDEDEDQPAAA